MKKERSGFTLLELVLVIALVGIITAVSYPLFFTGSKSFELGIDKGLSQEDNRIIREHLAKELRYASYLSNDVPDKEEYYFSTYYSLEIKENNNKYFLEKIEYSDGKVFSTTTMPIEFNELNIQSEEGNINIDFVPLKSETKYSYSIFLENNPLLNNINLTNNSEAIFYAYPGDSIKK